MLSENIRLFRSSRKMTQEELAVRVHVVRQTVSKWEKGLSVPDADQVTLLAETLEVKVNKLLGVNEINGLEDIASALAKANEQITAMAAESRRSHEIGLLRGKMLILALLAVAVSTLLPGQIIPIICMAAFAIAALWILNQSELICKNLCQPLFRNLKDSSLRTCGKSLRQYQFIGSWPF